MKDYSDYVSPFSMRYGSREMRQLFSELYKLKLWRALWVRLAELEYEAGLVTKEELADLKKHQDEISIERIHEIELETKHDVVASIKEFAEKAKIGGKKIHLGATSMDIVDNADAVRVQQALSLVETRVKNTLAAFTGKIEQFASTACIGYTHLQPAEPTTVGYRLAFYAQDLLFDLQLLEFVQETIRAKGVKGAVGTRASFTRLLEKTKLTPQQLDEKMLAVFELKPALITTQVVTRKFDFWVLTTLASTASSLAKFAADVRILQSPLYGEWSEPFAKTQVGSSAMPFKRNPVTAEKICSLARLVTQLPAVALENATLSYLERTLDDSANKRIIIAESFMALDEMLIHTEKIVSGLVINLPKIAQNLAEYAPFAATETLLIELVNKGADRQKMHEKLRELSLLAWSDVQAGKPNSLISLIKQDKEITKHLSPSEITTAFDVSHHIGDAPKRARELVTLIKKIL